VNNYLLFHHKQADHNKSMNMNYKLHEKQQSNQYDW